MKKERAAGILLHPTSLPGKFGIGQLGKEAYEFVDFLIMAGQKLWQMLPFNPTGYTNCPYSSASAFAGNPYLISYEKLVEEGLLEESELPKEEIFKIERVDFGKVYETVFTTLKKAYIRFKNIDGIEKVKYEKFCKDERSWLEDYALFSAVKDSFNGKPWFDWEKDIKFRKKEAVEKYKKELCDDIEFHKFMQYEFFKQWIELKNYANMNEIKIICDIPLYIAHDSADVWANPEIFQMDEELTPISKAGVPPDYFSATGQLWGNPLFNWENKRKDGYKWWIERVRLNYKVSDLLRFDHFRGFAGYWAVPWTDETAVNGKWEKGDGAELFQKVREVFGNEIMIAEDLGVITDDVKELRDKNGFFGMKILQFAFDSKDENDFIPHKYCTDSIVYTGALDNDTVKGWADSASKEDRE